MFSTKGKPVQERTDQHGKGMRYKVRWEDPNGKERGKSFPDKKLSEAKQFLTKTENDLFSKTYHDPNAGDVEFKRYAVEVLSSRSQDESSKKTNQSRLDNQIFPYFAGVRVSAFEKVETVRRWMAWLGSEEKNLSLSYQNAIFQLLSSILDAAVDDEKLRKNPCKNKSISAPRAKPIQVIPWKEQKLFLIQDALPERNRPAALLGAGLGLRQGEVLAFNLDSVDRREMVYHCTRQIVRVGSKYKFKLPKGHKPRSIPIGAHLLDKLDSYAELYPPVEVTLPWGERDGKKFETLNLLMTTENRKFYTRDNFNDNVWRKAFDVVGFEYKDRTDGMHALRHLFASNMLARAVSIKELAAFLGHSDEGFTLRTYTHLMPSSFERARRAMDALFRVASAVDDDKRVTK
ncbi:tyrosine-type recombinase/integrase [Amycolatopsis sp. PS_44_ISF1]|uniref:tyrosine-type recombinase/integrase n=1 Tax=Amycolatopsis sp. PS_44_ISF1 TaxID=2974917 RepID=UPI0028DF15BA|nr:site-specific integrase [Amycolatopsis sp. PS_44_ISF1]